MFLSVQSMYIFLMEYDIHPCLFCFDRYIFWTDWYRPAKIMRAWGDGSHAMSIVNTTLGWPNGLAIDWR